MTQKITVFGEDLDLQNVKVSVTFVGDQMVTTVQTEFSTGPDDDDRDILYSTTVYTPKQDDFMAELPDVIRTAATRYKEWLDSVGGVIHEPVDADS